MTVTSSTNSASYAGNGVSTDFTVPFRFLDNSHLRVALVDADGTEHTQVLNTDYTASGAGNATGGITFGTAPETGQTVQIFRNVPITQEKDYVTGDKFPAESHEQALDKLTMIAQQQDEKVGRAWLSPIGEPGGRIVAGTDGQPAVFNNGNIGGVDPGSVEMMIPADSSVTADKFVDGQTGLAAIVTKLSGFIGGLGALAKKSIVSLVDLADEVLFDLRKVNPNGPLNRRQHADANGIFVFGSKFAMGGFRIFGQYEYDRAPVFPAPASSVGGRVPASLTTDLSFGMTEKTLSNWYAAWMCANDGDTEVSPQITPFLFAKDVTGGVITLGVCGEEYGLAAGTSSNATYAWEEDALVGAEVLVISRGRGLGTGSSPSLFEPRITTVTANTNGTITLQDIGTLDAGTTLLLKPLGFDHTRYCGSFYVDAAEVGNFYDTGTGLVESRRSDLAIFHGSSTGDLTGTPTYLDGAFTQGTKRVDCNKMIPPLATGVLLQERVTLSTTSLGASSCTFDIDGSNHYAHISYEEKLTSANQWIYYSSMFQITFGAGQWYYPYTSGNATIIAARNNVRNNIYGYYEP